ncbi:transglutaminase family protein [Szabonella alba]|uniref:Transglutaminase family protein n=1 Tax=Szabonella alba TaxID=2804194 RepID=A0A8K0VC83_9RHOB|nr:transglutaminase family protein [Szabonella alba]MBL4916602.1 transglutaminase family protein [Szabonella alba]
MIYDIRLVIDYAYAAPSDGVRTILRLIPQGDAAQSVHSALLTIDPPPDERRDFTDFFGNVTTTVGWHHPVTAITYSLQTRIDRLPDPPFLDLSPPLAALAATLAAQQGLDPLSPHHFSGASARVAPLEEVTDFARDCLSPGMTVFQAVQAIGQALHRRLEFDAAATTVDTTPAEAFAQGRGVCQDFAHVMIAALRGIGVPAGYVSGFLRTFPPPGQPRLEGADAMHAWVQAWCGPEMGWVEFDPTNDQMAGPDYVTVARGRDYGDVLPVHGVLRSAGGQTSGQSVDMVPAEE